MHLNPHVTVHKCGRGSENGTMHRMTHQGNNRGRSPGPQPREHSKGGLNSLVNGHQMEVHGHGKNRGVGRVWTESCMETSLPTAVHSALHQTGATEVAEAWLPHSGSRTACRSQL